MAVFFTLFMTFIILSIVKSESDRKKKRPAHRPGPIEEIFTEQAQPKPQSGIPFTEPEPGKGARYHGEEVPRTTGPILNEEKEAPGKPLDLDLEKMIIYSEILKPKFRD